MMDADDGKLLGELVVDALAKAQEHVEDPNLLAATVVVFVEDEHGNVHAYAQTWPKAN